MRRVLLVLLSLLLLAGVWYFWPSNARPTALAAPVKAVPHLVSVAAPAAAQTQSAARPLAAIHGVMDTNSAITRSAASTNRVFFRLTNTSKSLAEMTASPHAILLENALVDTAAGLTLNIPKQLRAEGEPGAYIVQARGLVNNAFRSLLAGAGAEIVSYIPNNAYLVQVSAGGANALSGNALVQAVLPYQPYFKVQSSLLGLALKQESLPPGQVLTLGLYANGAPATMTQIEKMGGKIIGTDRSPFGPVVRVVPPDDWLALAQLSGVQRVEPATRRQVANDLARVSLGISVDAVTNANWLGLSGSNVVVEVNDTGIDASHPDFNLTGSAATPGPYPANPSRVTGYYPSSIIDVDGHGTHVAGVIAGNGSESYLVTNVPSGSVTNADFRGKAPAAQLFSYGFLGANDTNVPVSDLILQEIPALTNALISNNSWVNGGANEYDLSAASYDAAVRDALPAVTGPQPVLFVFPAGNAGGGDDSGFGGSSDTILSPGTAKNVITVGALEQYRGLTNTYTPLGSTNETPAWAGETSSDSQVAYYSSRGNVGVQTEGPFGRFKPDVVAPGTFVVSTRPTGTMWDQAAYYNPTNTRVSTSSGFVDTNTLLTGVVSVPINAVAVNIFTAPNRTSPTDFPTNLPIYISVNGPASPSNKDLVGAGSVSIPPDSGGAISGIGSLQNSSFNYAIGDSTNFPVSLTVVVQVLTTNDNGNLLTVLSNLNETIGPWYYYETGTSIAAPAASGSLALIQDFFTNTLKTIPSPALLKAMLINGARLTSGYNEYAVTNGVNDEGWGEINVPNSVPATLTNMVNVSGSNAMTMFFLDQSPTNALATGDSRTYLVKVPTLEAEINPLHITLAWTDPPGNPAAGIKLVNNLDLVVSNLDNPGEVYYGNIFDSGSTYSAMVDSNTVPDSINNVENVVLPPLLWTNYSVTVIGRNVTANAVTTEQTNVVQDFALVISCGDGNNPDGITVTPQNPVAASSTAPTVTFVSSYTNGIYFNQLAGANAPWLSTNNIYIDPLSVFGTNADLFVGQTNQWHFYVVTNTTTYTNAAFIIFLPNTLSTPRIGVYADSTLNSTRPEADLNLFVASDPDLNAGQLTNIDLTVISNCVYNVNGDQSALDRGGTKFIAYSNSAPGQVYYIGVQCQDQMAAEYGFLSVFSENPFSQLNPNGSQTVNGLLLPMPIPDGNNAHAGVAYVFGLALYPMEIRDVTVTNTIDHQNLSDLVGTLTHASAGVVLNNHNTIGSGPITEIYNDSGQPGTVGTAGPGSLLDFRRKPAIGPWIQTQVDDSQGQVGAITGFTMNIEPHRDLKNGFITVTVPPKSWYYDYVDVPVGYTNILVAATNLPPTSVPPIELYLNYNVQPDFTNYLVRADLTNGIPPGNTISYGPPVNPGTYWVGLYNPDTVAHDVLIGVFLGFDSSAINKVNWDSTGPTNLVDDAVMDNSIFVTNTDIIQGINVGLRVDHERISDLVFTLISPDGTRYLLMENRGGQSTNGAGESFSITNTTIPAGVSVLTGPVVNPANGHAYYLLQTNDWLSSEAWAEQLGGHLVTINDAAENAWVLNTFATYGGTDHELMIGLYDPSHDANGQPHANNFVWVDGEPLNYTNWRSGEPNGVNANPYYVYMYGKASAVSAYAGEWNDYDGNSFIVAEPPASGVVEVAPRYSYLTFTEDTNLTTTPIKYAVPPFMPDTNRYGASTNFVVWSNSFEESTLNGTETAGQYFSGGWLVDSGSVDTVPSGTFGSTAYSGGWWLDLNGNGPGQISTNVATVTGQSYSLSFAYTRNPGSFPSVPSAQVLVDSNALLTVSPGYTNTWTSLDWQTTSVVFTATSPLTHLTFASLSPSQSGVLLDAISLATNNSSNTTNLSGIYYQPEQSIDPLIGTSAYGDWTLEVLDNRAGATNNANLVSWQLQFTFANTNFTLATITNGFPGAVTNYIPGGGLQWYLVDVPTNADFATNTLIFADLPLNMWWSTNEPPTITNIPPDTELLTGVTSGSAVLSTNGSAFNTNLPAFIEPGGHYYLGIQNPNVAGANYAVEVTFHLILTLSPPTVVTEPATNIVTGAATLQALVTPNSTNTTVYFEYGLDTNSLSGPTASVLLTNNYTTPQLVTNNLTGLTPPGSVWYFRAVGTNIYGTNYGAILTFTNPYAVPPPYAFTAPATLVNGSSAQLNGFATPNGYDAMAWFEWGTSPAYTSNTPPVDVGTNFNVVFVYTNITGLLTNQAFHYRLVVSNEVGVTYGFDQVFAQGSVVTWGSDFAGQTLPLPPSLTNLVAGVGAGYDFSLALNFDGTVVGWGDDASGQTNVPAGLNNAVALAGGYAHALALRSDRTVTVWGDDTYNQTNAPADLTNAVAAASGAYHCLALRDDGNPVAWGRDNNNQTNIPAGLSNVVAVAAGFSHSLALKNDGTVVAWGNNASGQTNVPAGLTNVVAIAAGHDDSLALRRDGTVVAWGGGFNQTNVPTSLTNVTAITAGYYHCQALKGDGTVWFWGDSSSGQLNGYQGGFTNVNNPGSLTNVFAISGGGFHTLSVQALYGLNVTNMPPYWTNGFSSSTIISMDELTVTNINNAALDSNSPPQLVFYSGPTNNPSFVHIDSFSGVITLDPQEIDGPSTNTIVTVATDNGYPPLSSTNIFTLIVNEVNTPPFWTNGVPVSTNYTIGVGQLLTVTNTATDSDIPTNTLSYSVTVSPTNSAPTIDTNGIITWTPTVPGTFTLTTVVMDFNPWDAINPDLLATNYLTVTVTNGTPPLVNTNFSITSIIYTNIGGSNGFLLTWFAPSNELFQVQWTDALAPANWQTFTNPPFVSYNTNFFTSPTNTQFNFFDDGSQSGGFGPTRFYRLLLLQATNTLTLPMQTNFTAGATAMVIVTNTATDSRSGAVLTYSLVNPPAGAGIDTNGVITWTNAGPAGLAARFNTLVTDDSLPPVSATNTFTVFVTPLPSITNVLVTATSVTLTWSAPTNDAFNVRWATNLTPPVVWNVFPDTITSPVTGLFSFTDTNAPALMKFYQLILLP